MLRYILFVALLPLALGAQDKTKQQKNSDVREAAASHKVMLIPFEPKLYFSEIDRSVNKETGMSAKEIKHRFRDGINEQLYKAFKASKYNVVDLMDDTTKYKKDIEGIYQFLSYQYQKVPDQEHYKAPEKEKEEKKIKKGQLAVETNSDKRFMNAKVTNPKMVPGLSAKYKTDVFVFINELDIKGTDAAPGQSMGLEGNRIITVHYTVYTLDAREISSGLAETMLAPDVNNPKKIVDKYFSAIAATIVQRVNAGLGYVPVK